MLELFLPFSCPHPSPNHLDLQMTRHFWSHSVGEATAWPLLHARGARNWNPAGQPLQPMESEAQFVGGQLALPATTHLWISSYLPCMVQEKCLCPPVSVPNRTKVFRSKWTISKWLYLTFACSFADFHVVFTRSSESSSDSVSVAFSLGGVCRPLRAQISSVNSNY